MVIYLDDVFLTLTLLVPLGAGVYLRKTGRLDTALTCRLILAAGLILRVIYVGYTEPYMRQHDYYGLFTRLGGHGEYITYLFENARMPDFDPRRIMEFYHPPLHHAVCAAVLRVLDTLGFDVRENGDRALQLLPLIYSFLFAVVSCKALSAMKIKGEALALAAALVTFHPTLIILSGSLNNDMLSALFGMLAVYCTLRWCEDKRVMRILPIALSIGLGMMTKLSVALAAPAVAAVFLYELVKKDGSVKERLRLVGQYAVFGAVCVPLGLFFPVRSLVLFGVPLSYVPLLSESSGQFISVPAARRLLNWLPFQLASPFTQWIDLGAEYNEFNPVIALWKNAMFDEQEFFPSSITMQSFCTMLFFSGILLSLLGVWAHAAMWRSKAPFEAKLLLTLTSAVVFGSYIVFCLRFPHVCTENMRYCVPLIFTSAASVALCINGGEEKALLPRRFTAAVSGAFCGLSAFVYTGLMYFSH